MKNWLNIFPVIVAFLVLTNCGALSGEIGQDDTTGQPSLTSADYPNNGACLNRDTLPNDTTFLSTLTQADSVIYTYKEYISDAQLPAVCGLSDIDNVLESGEIGWDPELGINIFACQSFSESFYNFPITKSFLPEACRASFGYDSTDFDIQGFPRGGVYRADLCISVDENSYNIRIRLNISGYGVNKTWESLGIAEGSSFEVFNADDIQLTSMEDFKNYIVNNPREAVFTIRGSEGGTTYITANLQIICVKITTSCTAADEGLGC